MAIHLNETRIRGNVGRSPELRYSKKGDAIVNLSIATRPRRRNEDGEWEDGDTEWHQITCFRQVAERMAKQAQKGCLVDVTGRLTYDKYTRSGEDTPRYRAKILARDAQVMSTPARKPANESPSEENEEIPFPDDDE